jgi:hypothetical protein
MTRKFLEICSARTDSLTKEFYSMTRKLMSRMLQRLGHDVSQAENGSIALDMLRDRQFKNEKQFDILFLDKYVFANFSSSSH